MFEMMPWIRCVVTDCHGVVRCAHLVVAGVVNEWRDRSIVEPSAVKRQVFVRFVEPVSGHYGSTSAPIQETE
ncbi:hypothetical protein [Actinophytocola sp. KF-1]